MAEKKQVRKLRDTLRMLVRRLGILERGEASCCGVTLAQCHVLCELGATGQMSLNDLAETLRLDKSTVSRSVDTMVGCCLVSRATDPGDRRFVTLGLSDQGRRVLDDIEDRMDVYFAEIVDQLPADKRDQVLESLALLAEAAKGPGCCEILAESCSCNTKER